MICGRNAHTMTTATSSLCASCPVDTSPLPGAGLPDLLLLSLNPCENQVLIGPLCGQLGCFLEFSTVADKLDFHMDIGPHTF
jgi:hypothetical protein